MEHEVFGSHCWTRRWWSSSTEISARYVVIDCVCRFLVLYRIVQLSWCTLTNGFASGGSARSCLPLPGCKGDQPVDPTRRCVVVASIFVHAAVQCNVYCMCRYNCYMVYCMAYLICLITSCQVGKCKGCLYTVGFASSILKHMNQPNAVLKYTELNTKRLPPSHSQHSRQPD